MKPYIHIVVWAEGFPLKISASNGQNSSLAALFKDSNCDYTLTSKSYYKNWDKNPKPNVIFFNTKNNSFVNYIIAIIKEIQFIRNLRKDYSKVVLLASYTNFFIYLFYSIICHLLKAKLILNIMEWHIAQFKYSSLIQKLNPYLFDNIAFRISDGAIVISSYLVKELSKQNKNKKILRIPVLSDIKKIDSIKGGPNICDKYFAYCANIGYIEIINLIIEAFEIFIQQSLNEDYKLFLVLNGDPIEIGNVKNSIAEMPYGKRISVFSLLEYSKLIQLYKKADILLLPLRDTEQDKARYPHKIGDYTICGRPIISNKIGEIGNEFEHKNDIIFSDSFDAHSLAKSMLTLVNDKDLKNRIGVNARFKGETLFDRSIYAKETYEFINNL